ncbi:Apo Saccharopine reductase [Biscogniauxia mediterranea]|nr:Apo Saccharopine reductase [Biscogniauxia mediterranea]
MLPRFLYSISSIPRPRFLTTWNRTSKIATMAQQNVLMLGAGFVTRPTLDILSDAGIQVSVACRTLEKAKSLAEGVKNARPISLDVTDEKALDAEVAKHDLVISLIPYTFHATVIKSAIRQKKHVVTTSYVSPAMMELDQQCKDAGITVMNEIGLDPGIDHLYAVKTISEVHEAGGKILSFLSYCGGLCAPEDSGNPLGYKFSWSSRGVLLALRNPASFYQGGKVVNVPGPELMAQAKPYPIYPGFAFVAYPNRDSTPYKERYNIPEAQTIIRGTLRYAGFPEFIKLLVDMGFLSDEENSALNEPISWKEATQKILGASGSNEQDLLAAINSKASFKDDNQKEQLLAGLKWIGLFSSEKIIPRGNPLDTLCATLEKKMQFEEGERDLVMLQHKFEIENKDGSRETRTSTLCEYGAPVGSGGYSAMAKLVGVPCGVAVKQVLNGTISDKGILAPMSPRINDPLIKELKEKYGIECKEKVIA